MHFLFGALRVNTFHAYQVPSFYLLWYGDLIVCFVYVSVCAKVQLEMHRPEYMNKITDVRGLTCTTFILYLTFTASIYDGKCACFHGSGEINKQTLSWNS